MLNVKISRGKDPIQKMISQMLKDKERERKPMMVIICVSKLYFYGQLAPKH